VVRWLLILVTFVLFVVVVSFGFVLVWIFAALVRVFGLLLIFAALTML